MTEEQKRDFSTRLSSSDGTVLGTQVKINGLKSASARQYNGKTARVTKRLDADTGRLCVRLDGTGRSLLSIKPENLSPVGVLYLTPKPGTPEAERPDDFCFNPGSGRRIIPVYPDSPSDNTPVFVYTEGVSTSHPACVEFIALDVKLEDVHAAAMTFDFLTRRLLDGYSVCGGQMCESGGMTCHIIELDDSNNRYLLENYACQCGSGSSYDYDTIKLLLIVPVQSVPFKLPNGNVVGHKETKMTVIRKKWSKHSMFWIRSIDGNPRNAALYNLAQVSPYQAMLHPEWTCTWIMDLSEEEIEFVRSHSTEFASTLKPRNEKSLEDRLFDDEEHNPSADVHYELGCTYRDGSDKIMKDEKKSLFHFRVAAIGGYFPARHELALYECKKGTDRSARLVARHIKIACKHGYERSFELIRELCMFSSCPIEKRDVEEAYDCLMSYKQRMGLDCVAEHEKMMRNILGPDLHERVKRHNSETGSIE